MTRSRTLGEAFEKRYRGGPLESFSFGPPGIESLSKHPSATFTIEVDVFLSPAVVGRVEKRVNEIRASEQVSERTKSTKIRERYLRYKVSVQINTKTGHLTIADEYAAALKADGTVKESVVPYIAERENKIILKMEKQSHPFSYDKHLDYTILSTPLYAPYYPHLTALKAELSEWFIFYFEPRERMRAQVPVKEVRNIGLMGEDLAPFLNTLRVRNPAQFRAIEQGLHTLIPSISGIHIELNKFGEVELYITEGKTRIPARIVSEGTLRILGLLALRASSEPASLIGFEEPENGIHPRRIQMIAEYLTSSSDEDETSVIVTTHSPTLLDYLPETSLYSVQKRDGITTINSFAAEGELWRTHMVDELLNKELVSDLVLQGALDG